MERKIQYSGGKKRNREKPKNGEKEGISLRKESEKNRKT